MNLKKNPELIPLIEWWEKDGKQLVACVAVAAIAVGGWYGWKAHKAAVREASGSALVNAYTTEEIEDAVAKFGSTPTAGALKLRLAKSYFEAGRYEEAMGLYAELEGGAPDGFADIPVVGKAQCLEAMGKFAEAQAAFDAFAEANPKHYLTLTAQLGAIRSVCQLGDKEGALKRLEEIKGDYASETIAKARIEATESLIKRFEKKAAASAVQAPVVKPVEVKPTETNEVKKVEKTAK